MKNYAFYIETFFVTPLFLMFLTPCLISNRLAYGVVSTKFFWLFFCAIFLLPFLAIYIVKKKYIFDKFDITLLILALYMTASAWHYAYLGLHDKKLDTFISGITGYFGLRIYLFSNYKRDKFRKILLLVAIFQMVSIYINVSAIAQLIHFTPYINQSYLPSGTFYHPGPFAGFNAVSLILSAGIWHYLQRRRAKRPLILTLEYLIAINCLLIISTLPFTESRAGYLALLLGIGYFIKKVWPINYGRRIWELKTFKFIGIPLLLILTFGIAFFLYHIRSQSVDGRLLIWKISFQIPADSPFTGVGLNQFSRVYSSYQAKYFSSGLATVKEVLLSDEVSSTFNEPIQIFCELGIIGVVVFLYVIFLALTFDKNNSKSFSRHINELPISIAASIVAFLAFSLVSYPFSLPELILQFFFLLSISKPALYHTSKISAVFNKYFAFLFFFLPLVLLFNVPDKVNLLVSCSKWQEANISARQSDYPDALKVYDSLLSKLQNEERFLSDYAEFLQKQEQIEKSLSVLKMKKMLSYADLISIADLNHRLRKFKDAITYYQKAYYLLPHKFYPLDQIRKTYLDLGEKKKAINIAQEIIDKPIKLPSEDVDLIKGRALNTIKIETF